MLGLLKQKGQNKMNYKIYKATIKDLDDMYNMQKNEPNLLISYDALKSDLQDKNKLYFITKDEKGNINSFAGISLLVDHIDIENILVKEEYKKLKIASFLLNTIIEYCKKGNISKLFLEVRTSNLPAINLYEKFNFKNIAIRRNYYPDNNEDAYVYMLEM